MKVEQILQTKGAQVYAVSPSATVEEAVNVLGEKNVGAVLVKDDDQKIAGIISERDVVRMVREKGSHALAEKVSVCMTEKLFTCSPEMSVNDLMMEMTDRRIRHVPVIKSDVLVGIVSIGDVVKRKIEETEQEAAALKEYIAS